MTGEESDPKANEPAGQSTRKARPRAPCPACGKVLAWSSANPYRPFCSERCKVIDLGAWATEQYKIAGNPQEKPPDDEI